MNPAQFIEKIQALPPDKQVEVLDFIEFLASRSSTQLKTKQCLAEWLMAMPDVGLDEDFMRVDESARGDDVFN